MKQPCVYILTSRKHGTLYIGVTSNLIKRIWEHRESVVKGFTKDYDVHKIIYFEQFERMEDAIAREKQLKKWNRDWKINLIEANNPEWVDLYPALAM